MHDDPIIEYVTLDGERIETTPTHPFYTQEHGWQRAVALRVGMQVRQADGDYGTVQAIEFVRRVQPMYDLTVAEAHTFFVGRQQWLVHNCPLPNLKSRPFANSTALNNGVIEQMYRGEWVGGQWTSYDTIQGGLAGAVRREMATGELVGGVSHLPKGQQRLAQLKDILTRGRIGNDILGDPDLAIVRALHDDLLKALQGQ